MPHSKEELAWVAGIFEGEGCVLVTKSLHTRVSVTNTDKKILEELKRIAGGDICSGGISKSSKHIKRWRMENSKVFNFLRDILPYMVGGKKNEFLLALGMEKLICIRGKRLDEEIIEKRSIIRIALQKLKFNMGKTYVADSRTTR